MSENKELTGYPSIDKPWLKYYSREAIEAKLPEKTLWQYAYENNKEYPNDVAFRYFGTKITYGKFFDYVREAALAFVSFGVKSGDIVTIMSMNTPETIYALYALNYLGAAANMVYMTLSAKEILESVKNTDSKLLLVLDPAMEKIDGIRSELSVPVVVLAVSDSMPVYLKAGYRLKSKTKYKNTEDWHAFIRNGKGCALPKEASEPEKLAVIVYTSGTTGEPKGVMLSNNALNAHVFQDVNGLFDFERKKTFLFWLPLFLGYGVSHLHTYICTGLELIIQVDMSMDAVANAFYKYKPQCVVSSPVLVDHILKNKNQDKNIEWLEIFVSGGGEISAEKENGFNDFLDKHKSKARYCCGYGMTEAGSTLCVNGRDIREIGSAGVPFLCTVVKAVDVEKNCEVRYGQEGELHFSTPDLMMGYFQNEQATKEAVYFDDEGVRWIKSGDIGYIDENGFVYVTGRIKRIFFTKDSKGVVLKLFPQRIEELLQTDQDVESCGVVVRADKERENIAIAFVCLVGDSVDTKKRTIVRDRLFSLAKKELPEHEQPADIVFIEKMPLTPSGKIDYRALKERGGEGDIFKL